MCECVLLRVSVCMCTMCSREKHKGACVAVRLRACACVRICGKTYVIAAVVLSSNPAAASDESEVAWAPALLQVEKNIRT